jgi:hypothetical protein
LLITFLYGSRSVRTNPMVRTCLDGKSGRRRSP